MSYKEAPAGEREKTPQYKYYDNVTDLKSADRWKRLVRSLLLTIVYIALPLILIFSFRLLGFFLSAILIIMSPMLPRIVVDTPDIYYVMDRYVLYGKDEMLMLKGCKIKMNKKRNLVIISRGRTALLYLYSHKPDLLYRILERLTKEGSNA